MHLFSGLLYTSRAFSLTHSIKVKGIVVILICLFTTSCAIKNGSINTYINPSYRKGEIAKLAFLSFSNQDFSNIEAKMIDKMVLEATRKKNPEIKILTHSETMKLIVENALEDELEEFLNKYNTEGIVDKHLLLKFSKHLGIDGIIRGRLINKEQNEGDGFFLRGESRIRISYSILKCKTGKSIWEVTANGVRVNALDTLEPPPMIEAVNLAINKVTDSIPHL